jgi:hypothetical protein
MVATFLLTIGFAVYQTVAVERLGQAQHETVGAYDQAKEQQRQAEKLAAGLALERGQELCDQGQGVLGLLWLARALRSAVQAEDAGLGRVIRTNLDFETRQAPVLQARWPHAGTVTAVALSPNGRLAVTAGEKDVHFGDTETGARACPPLQHQGTVDVVLFSPDGNSIATVADRAARLGAAATVAALTLPLIHRQRVMAAALSSDDSGACRLPCFVRSEISSAG